MKCAENNFMFFEIRLTALSTIVIEKKGEDSAFFQPQFDLLKALFNFSKHIYELNLHSSISSVHLIVRIYVYIFNHLLLFQ